VANKGVLSCNGCLPSCSSKQIAPYFENEFLNSILGEYLPVGYCVDQACLTFYVVRENSAVSGPHASNVNFNKQNE
jgi:hypothetical protein